MDDLDQIIAEAIQHEEQEEIERRADESTMADIWNADHQRILDRVFTADPRNGRGY